MSLIRDRTLVAGGFSQLGLKLRPDRETGQRPLRPMPEHIGDSSKIGLSKEKRLSFIGLGTVML